MIECKEIAETGLGIGAAKIIANSIAYYGIKKDDIIQIFSSPKHIYIVYEKVD